VALKAGRLHALDAINTLEEDVSVRSSDLSMMGIGNAMAMNVRRCGDYVRLWIIRYCSSKAL
jgi:hypothetical protein